MTFELYHGDCLTILPTLADNSVDAIVTDPPYFGVKSDDWDNQWKGATEFVAWIGTLCQEFRRVLKSNGSLYLFASPRMAARVEVEVGKWFNVLNRICWAKPAFSTKAEMNPKHWQRLYFPTSEYVIFAEHYGADSAAKGEAGYVAKCDELRGFVFEPVYRYLAGEFAASGLSRREVDDHFRTANVSQYWLQPRGFIIPTAEKYAGLQRLRPHHFRREYEDLRREYEDLRREYEDLRRPFQVTADVPYTDVWDFPTVGSYPGKNPCEKPLAMMRHIVTASTRPGAVVLDPFMGSGTTGRACEELGRSFIGIEQDARYFAQAKQRIEQAGEVPALFKHVPEAWAPANLFAEAAP